LPDPAPSPLVKFLLELANDPDKLAAFRRDPKSVLSRRRSIPAAERELLARGDLVKLREAVGGETLFILVLMSPAPKPSEPAPKPAPKPKPAARRRRRTSG
jgi:hypothetical protein